MDINHDLRVSRAAKLKHITEIAAGLGIPEDHLECYGRHKAKISNAFIDSLERRPDGKLILVTAMSPPPAGGGKTTTSVGLHDALCLLGKRSIVCLREPSLGPCFGMKGGAAGGGRAQVVPMEDINLHFTGDFHAITAANNLLAAVIDNYIHHSNELRLDLRRVTWRRVMDMNDRALRSLTIALGGASNGFPRESGFDIARVFVLRSRPYVRSYALQRGRDRQQVGAAEEIPRSPDRAQAHHGNGGADDFGHVLEQSGRGPEGYR